MRGRRLVSTAKAANALSHPTPRVTAQTSANRRRRERASMDWLRNSMDGRKSLPGDREPRQARPMRPGKRRCNRAKSSVLGGAVRVQEDLLGRGNGPNVTDLTHPGLLFAFGDRRLQRGGGLVVVRP